MMNGNIYTNKDFNFSLEIPPPLQIDCSGKYSCLIFSSEKLGRPENFISIKIIPEANNDYPDDEGYELITVNKLMNLRIGESLSTENDRVMKKFFTYRRLTDQVVDGINAMVFENKLVWESIPGTVERKVYFYKNSDLFIIEAFTESADIPLSLFNKIISTFRFVKQNEEQ